MLSLMKHRGTRYSSAAELTKPGTRRILMRKNVSALRACLPLVVLARTCMSHHAWPEKMLHQLSLARHSWE